MHTHTQEDAHTFLPRWRLCWHSSFRTTMHVSCEIKKVLSNKKHALFKSNTCYLMRQIKDYDYGEKVKLLGEIWICLVNRILGNHWSEHIDDWRVSIYFIHNSGWVRSLKHYKLETISNKGRVVVVAQCSRGFVIKALCLVSLAGGQGRVLTCDRRHNWTSNDFLICTSEKRTSEFSLHWQISLQLERWVVYSTKLN